MRTIEMALGLSLLVATPLLVASPMLAASPALADPALAGGTLVTASHGQPFCTDEGELLALLHASIAGARFGSGAFPGCVTVSDGAPVLVTQDLSPGTREMHVVRARAETLFGTEDGYTWSVGLYPR